MKSEAVVEQLGKRVEVACRDPEFTVSVQGLEGGLDLEVVAEGTAAQRVPVLAGAPGTRCLTASAAASVWESFLSECPPVGRHSVTAALRSGALALHGQAVQGAQALHALERLFEILRGQDEETPQALPLQSISGHYAALSLAHDEQVQVYVEASGNLQAPVLLMLHTAGADARQFHALMADEALRRDWHMVAFDMPGHGRSMPRAGEAWRPYALTKADYLAICHAFVTQHLRQKVVVLGCSMGAAMALKLAREFPSDVWAAVALEAPWKATGRRSPMLCHAQVNQVAHNAAYVRGLMSPLSPLALRRRAAWIYGQGGFGVYAGDLVFYTDDFDAEADLAGLDAATVPVVLLTGAYDYSASPTDTAKVAALIPGARFTIMQDLGHFPMVENPGRLLHYLRPELDWIKTRGLTHGD